MISAEFYSKNGVLFSFSIKGHAGYADFGEDIVCSAVTSAVELTANAITEVLKISAAVDAIDDEVKLTLPTFEKCEATNFLEALRFHLLNLSKDYKQNLRIINMEV